MNRLFIFLIFNLLSFLLQAQVDVINTSGTPTPDASAALQVTSQNNDKGVLIPRLTDYQAVAIASPAVGLLVFDNVNNVFKFYNGISWMQMGTISQTANPTAVTIKDAGDLYFNTATLNMNYYNGSSWMKFVKTGTSL
jgi:hypothetical protein